MPLELWLKVTDVKSGKVELHQPSHSWTHVWCQLLCGFCKNGALANAVYDVSGVDQKSYACGGSYWEINAVSGTNLYGIVVGTSTQAESINDNKLISIIQQGVGAGQMQYGGCTQQDPYDNSGTVSMIIQRLVTNQSGGTITINEIGVYVRLYNSSYYYYCIIRDVLGVGVSVTNGSSKLIEYVFQTVN